MMGRVDLVDDPRFSTQAGRLTHSAEVDAVVGEWTSTLPKVEIAARLNAAGVAAAEVREPKEAIRDPRVVARGETRKLHIRCTAMWMTSMALVCRSASQKHQPSSIQLPHGLVSTTTRSTARCSGIRPSVSMSSSRRAAYKGDGQRAESDSL